MTTLGPETLTVDLGNPNLFVGASTTAVALRIAASGQDATNTGTSYRCMAVFQ